MPSCWEWMLDYIFNCSYGYLCEPIFCFLNSIEGEKTQRKAEKKAKKEAKENGFGTKATAAAKVL